ncbi:MAG: hypothetical protein Q4G07_08945, partial [Oscillospiraceae bacterium]|nr:hypothetical protein [Oscillospiraceae bacterium]
PVVTKPVFASFYLSLPKPLKLPVTCSIALPVASNFPKVNVPSAFSFANIFTNGFQFVPSGFCSLRCQPFPVFKFFLHL